jgi:hypothetical protein
LWGHCGHDEHWFPCPDLPPFLLWRCARVGPLPYTTGVPDQNADWIGFPIQRSGDHFPNTAVTMANHHTSTDDQPRPVSPSRRLEKTDACVPFSPAMLATENTFHSRGLIAIAICDDPCTVSLPTRSARLPADGSISLPATSTSICHEVSSCCS